MMNEIVLIEYNGIIAAYKNGRLHETVPATREVISFIEKIVGYPPAEVHTGGLDFPPKNLYELDWQLTMCIDYMPTIDLKFVVINDVGNS
jgi:hypothetical protein